MTAFLLSIMLLSNPTFASIHEYRDIARDSEDFYPIDYLRRNGVFQDTAYFKPETLVSKAEFIKYLVILNNPEFKPNSEPVKLPYSDTQGNSWYAPYLNEAIRLGILSGKEETIDPYAKLSLIDALTLLFQSQSIPIPKVYKGDIPYTDVQKNQISQALIMRALEFDLMKPERPDYVGIYQRVTRADAARMIYKMDLVNLSSPTKASASESQDPQLEKIINAWDLIFNSFINKDEINKDDVADAALHAMAEKLGDPYTTYMDHEENQAFTDNFDGQIEGIGAFIGLNDAKEILVISPIVGSPAELAGVKAGDVIVKVDDTEITPGMDLTKAVSLIKGPKGSTVSLTLRRNSETVVITVVRDVVKVESLTYDVQGNGKVMVIKLTQFNQNAGKQFDEVSDIIAGSSNIKGIIIDVRNNPGGLLDTAVSILGHLIEKGAELLTVQYSYFNYTQYNKGGQGELSDYPIVVLTNKGSASASEILAGAIQDYGFGKIVGETSYGKGTVQEVNYFIDNSSLKITVAKWLTPLNTDINKAGITPDIQVADNPNTETDEQMNRALNEVIKMIGN